MTSRAGVRADLIEDQAIARYRARRKAMVEALQSRDPGDENPEPEGPPDPLDDWVAKVVLWELALLRDGLGLLLRLFRRGR